MLNRLAAIVLLFTFPAGATAGPLEQAVRKAALELAAAQEPEQPRSRGRMWTGLLLIGGGGVLAVLGGLEIGDDESGADDGEDFDDSDDGEDSDGWANKAMLGGGIAAATVGGIVLLTGRPSPSVVSIRPGRASVRHTIRF
jgi:hypothetical protein